MKPEKRINSILNNFLEQFDCKSELDTDFAYYYSKSLITYSFVVTERDERNYLNFIRTLAPNINVDIFLISFLHELGHHMTIDEIEEDEELFCQDEKEIISTELSLCENDYEIDKVYNRYFTLPDEYAATKWAIDYIYNNKDIVSKLWFELQKEIIDFYKKI